jgi:hypothetical protein
MQLVFGPEEAVDLTLEKRDTKSASPPAFVPAVLEKRFTISTPQVLALTPERLQDDPEAAAFMRAAGSVAFDVVSLSCTFYSNEKEPFEEAWVGVRLHTKENRQDAPIAWSMKPMHDSDLIEESGTIKVEAGLKLFNDVEPTLGLEIGDKRQRQQNFVTAFGLQQSEPYWYFRKTSQRDLEGSYRLTLVVRRSKKTPTTGMVSAKATVRKTAALVFTYKSSFEPAPSLSFTLR